MGIKGVSPKTVLWEATGLNLKSLKKMRAGNRIDVDGNALAWKLGAGKHINEVVHLMAVYLKDVAHSGGFIITVVLDGDLRPDCRRDSWFRKKDRALDDINRFYCRLKTLELGSEVHTLDRERSEKRKEDFDLFNNAAKKLERKCSRNVVIPKNFGSLLSERLMMIDACQLNENGGFVQEKYLKAVFQADSLIARRAMQKKSNYILSEDSDFAALLGRDCMMIKTISKKNHAALNKGRRGKRKKLRRSCSNSVACGKSVG